MKWRLSPCPGTLKNVRVSTGYTVVYQWQADFVTPCSGSFSVLFFGRSMRDPDIVFVLSPGNKVYDHGYVWLSYGEPVDSWMRKIGDPPKHICEFDAN